MLGGGSASQGSSLGGGGATQILNQSQAQRLLRLYEIIQHLVNVYGVDLKIPYILENLNQPGTESSDLTALVAAIRNFTDTSSTLYTTIGTLQSGLTTANANIGTVTTAVSTMRNMADTTSTLEAFVRANGTNITSLQTYATSLNEVTIPAITSDVWTLKNVTIPAINTSITSISGVQVNHETRLLAAESDLIAASGTLYTYGIQIYTNRDDITALNTTVTNQIPTTNEKTFLTALDTRASNTASNVALMSDIASLGTYVDVLHMSNVALASNNASEVVIGTGIVTIGYPNSPSITTAANRIVLNTPGYFEINWTVRHSFGSIVQHQLQNTSNGNAVLVTVVGGSPGSTSAEVSTSAVATIQTTALAGLRIASLYNQGPTGSGFACYHTLHIKRLGP